MAITELVSVEEYLHSTFEHDAEYLEGRIVARSAPQKPHHGGRADRGERAAVRRYRFHGKSVVRYSPHARRQQGHQGPNPGQARVPDGRANEFPAAAV